VLERRTLAILGVLALVYALIVAAAYAGPAVIAEPSAMIVIFTVLSAHLFHHFGVPGLLEHGGLCGPVPCAPTPLGWAFIVLFWLALAWLLAWGLARLYARL
jgi:hypothetical protein